MKRSLSALLLGVRNEGKFVYAALLVWKVKTSVSSLHFNEAILIKLKFVEHILTMIGRYPS